METHPKLSALEAKQKRLISILKEERGTTKGAKVRQPGKYIEHTRLSRSIREHLKRSGVIASTEENAIEICDLLGQWNSGLA